MMKTAPESEPIRCGMRGGDGAVLTGGARLNFEKEFFRIRCRIILKRRYQLYDGIK